MRRALKAGLLATLLVCAGCAGAPSSAANLPATEATLPPATAPKAAPAPLLCTEAPTAPSGDLLARVEIEGYALPIELCAFLKTRAGQTWSEAGIDADIRALWADGRIEDVTAFHDDSRKAIVFSVRMRPTVTAFQVQGADAPGLPDELRFARPSLLNLATVVAQAARAEGALKDAGWLSAKVDYAVTPVGTEGDGKVSLSMQVAPGPRALVQSIQLQGPSTSRAVELLLLLRTAKNEPFEALMLERDVLVIQADGYDRGLVMTKVEKPEIVVLDGGKGVQITLRVNEGQVFHLGKVSFQGDLIGSSKTYEKTLWSSAPNAVFSRSVVAADLERIRAFHASHGAAVDVSPETNIDAERGLIDVVVRVTKRP